MQDTGCLLYSLNAGGEQIPELLTLRITKPSHHLLLNLADALAAERLLVKLAERFPEIATDAAARA